MLNYRRINSCILLTIVVSHCLLHTLAYPQSVELPRRLSSSSRQEQDNQQQQQQQQLQQPQQQQLQPSSDERSREARKFAVKPNAQKKVALDDIDDDIEGNQIQESSGSVGGSGLSGLGGFSWSNMLSAFFSMLFNNAGNAAPTKSDDADNSVGFGGSPWANVISVGLKIVNTLLGGGAPSDGIDKVDNGGSPMQGILAAVLSSVLGTKDPEQVNSMAKQAGEFIQIVMNLLDALKTSFSHRSLAARSLGKRDSVSDATVAGIAMLKGYVRTYRNADEKCMQRYMCDANTECVREIGGASIFCQLGSYATSFVLGRTTGSQFEPIYDAGRRGRSGFDCNQLYLECNEV